MRIVQVATPFESVPRGLYGWTERVVSYLTQALVRSGHEVTLFASGDSQTTPQLVAGCPTASWRDPDIRETLPQHVRLYRSGIPAGVEFRCRSFSHPLVPSI